MTRQLPTLSRCHLHLSGLCRGCFGARARGIDATPSVDEADNEEQEDKPNDKADEGLGQKNEVTAFPASDEADEIWQKDGEEEVVLLVDRKGAEQEAAPFEIFSAPVSSAAESSSSPAKLKKKKKSNAWGERKQ